MIFRPGEPRIFPGILGFFRAGFWGDFWGSQVCFFWGYLVGDIDVHVLAEGVALAQPRGAVLDQVKSLERPKGRQQLLHLVGKNKFWGVGSSPQNLGNPPGILRTATKKIARF